MGIGMDFCGIAQMKVGFITLQKIGVQTMAETLPEMPTSTNVLEVVSFGKNFNSV